MVLIPEVFLTKDRLNSYMLYLSIATKFKELLSILFMDMW